MKRLRSKRTGRVLPVVRALLVIAGAAALLITPCIAQVQSAQTQNPLALSEFRQVLVDLGAYIDAHKGTNLASQFSALSDEQLEKAYQAAPNSRELQTAVAALKEHDAAVANGSTPAPRAMSVPRAQVTPNAVFGSCPPGSIIDNSTGATCTPNYPDPNNTSWQTVVKALFPFGAFSPTDYPDVSSQSCGLTVEANLEQVNAILTGILQTLSPICSALPPIASNVCWAAAAVVAGADQATAGLFLDCTWQDGNVNAAEVDAGFHNTVTIFNALNTGFASASTQLTNVNNQITGEFGGLTTQVGNTSSQITALSTQVANVDVHLTNVDNHIATEFATLTTAVNQATAQLNAELKQIMKLELEPNGQKVINPAILTCTGSNCPNVLAACPTAGCSWNNVGPLP
ncbi:MAG: hypothetical protein JOY54_15195 [Acidobacteriaceae bacterium]|nr:hypothetical protein [Acidobacteriaceae bacterium]